ncbi:MAG: transposase [Desulfobacteraceae bacterium]|nr:transposase [Desulfobacteraceae bacterium]
MLGDSGYDCKAIQNTIVGKGWDFIIALKKKRVSNPRQNTYHSTEFPAT